jgi:hypothetical protein
LLPEAELPLAVHDEPRLVFARVDVRRRAATGFDVPSMRKNAPPFGVVKR